MLVRVPVLVQTDPLLLTISSRLVGPAEICGAGGVTAWLCPRAPTCWLRVIPVNPVTTCSAAAVGAAEVSGGSVMTGTADPGPDRFGVPTWRNGCTPPACDPG